MKTKIFTFLIIIFYFSTGCFLNFRKDFDKLSDREFYFSEFQFILPGQDKNEAYVFFQKFPVKKILFLLAKEYKISINIGDFNNFIKNKDISLIKTDGLFRIIKHTWERKNLENNKITFIFEQDYLDDSKLKFKIGIYQGNSTLKILSTNLEKIDEIFNKLRFYLQTGKESIKEYEEEKYDEISPIPLIIETIKNSSNDEELKNVIQI